LVLAGAKTIPERVWFSKSGSLLDFNSTDGLIFDVYHELGIALQWIAGKSELVFGGDVGEGVITGNRAALTNTNFQVRVESGYGSANLQGKLVNEAIFYLQDGAKKVRQFAYHEEGQGWRSPDLTIMADHITESEITEVALQRNPDTVFWCVRNDGVLVGITYELRYNVAGWHRHIPAPTLAGASAIESIAIVRGSSENEIYVSVKRTVNGTTKRFIEYFKPRDFGSDQEDCFFVQSGITLDKGAAVSITNITQNNPVVVTAPGHSFAATDKVRIANVGGATELNGKVWEVQNPVGDNFELKETADFAAWSSTTTYNTGSIVKYSGKNYISLQDNNLNKQPDIETSWWALWPTAYTSGGTVREVVNSVSGLSHLEGETV
jgi:hypothetical protein